MKNLEVKARIDVNKNLILNSHEFNNYRNLMEVGDYILSLKLIEEPKTIEEYRAQYFAMRDIVADSTGNSKKDLHIEVKEIFLDGGSTKELNEEGWKYFIKEFKSWAFETLNIYL